MSDIVRRLQAFIDEEPERIERGEIVEPMILLTDAMREVVRLLAEVERLQRERAEWRDRADALMTEQMTQMRDLTAEVEALRARCKRLRDYALAAYAYVELLERGHTERIPGTMAKTSRWVSEAHDRLHPGDLADLDAAEEGRTP